MTSTTDVRITHLQMTDRHQIRPGSPARTHYQLIRCEVPTPGLNRFLYATVGAQWKWRDRLTWSHTRWQEYLAQESIQTWVAYVRGSPAGYFELERSGDGSVEIAYFGLLPAFIGTGIGGQFLTDALEQAWNFDASRVWLHTCTFDHPAAISNYQRRGLDVFHVEHKTVQVTEPGPEAWPGAGPIPGTT